MPLTLWSSGSVRIRVDFVANARGLFRSGFVGRTHFLQIDRHLVDFPGELVVALRVVGSDGGIKVHAHIRRLSAENKWGSPNSRVTRGHLGSGRARSRKRSLASQLCTFVKHGWSESTELLITGGKPPAIPSNTTTFEDLFVTWYSVYSRGMDGSTVYIENIQLNASDSRGK